jgi:hypothetical protein
MARTFRDLMENGPVPSRSCHRDETRILWEQYQTEFRYHLLLERLRERRSLIRTLNRRFRRQCGLSLKGA